MPRDRRMFARSGYSSRRLGKCNDSTFLLFYHLIGEADDEGRGEGDAYSIRLKANNRTWSEKKIDSMMETLSSHGLVCWYTNNGGQWYEVVNFLDYQKGSWHGKLAIDSKIPSPCDSESSLHQSWCTTTPLTTDPYTKSRPKVREGKVSKEKVREENPTSQLLITSARTIKGWNYTQEQESDFFQLLLQDYDQPLIEKTIKDLATNQISGKKKYTDLMKTLRNWCGLAKRWQEENPTTTDGTAPKRYHDMLNITT